MVRASGTVKLFDTSVTKDFPHLEASIEQHSIPDSLMYKVASHWMTLVRNTLPSSSDWSLL